MHCSISPSCLPGSYADRIPDPPPAVADSKLFKGLKHNTQWRKPTIPLRGMKNKKATGRSATWVRERVNGSSVRANPVFSLPAPWFTPCLFKIKGCSLTQQLTGCDCLGSASIQQHVLRRKRAATDWLQKLPTWGSCINKSVKWANLKPQLLSSDSLFEYLGKLTLAVLLRDKAHKDQEGLGILPLSTQIEPRKTLYKGNTALS